MSNGSFIEVKALGYLGADPKPVKGPTGDVFAYTFSIAADDKWLAKDGTERERTEWLRVALKGKATELAKFLHKGDRVLAEGTLETRTWKDADGQDQRITECVIAGVMSRLTFLSPKPKEA